MAAAPTIHQLTNPPTQKFLRAVAATSGVYDASIGLTLLLAPGVMAAWFGVAPAHPPIFSDLNGLFLLSIGIGYWFPWRDPRGARWYLWVMGPGLKGAGAVAFCLDYALRHSPASFLLFAFSDGSVALLTLVALLASRSRSAA
ncbi:MAG TPA: hypothetical protein VFK20_14005 [Vicinamibacterales bacterium]|nr:hypothetical protein [Vicinamibacterales bacterium]